MTVAAPPAATAAASAARGWDPLRLVGLDGLMRRGAGSPGVAIGLVDGPVVTGHPGLAAGAVREIGEAHAATCTARAHPACVHGTFVAGVLAARRGSGAPAICPGSPLLVRPIFSDRASRGAPGATPRELADGIRDCVAAGARVVNVSAALYDAGAGDERPLVEALDEAARRGAIVVVAAGNDAATGGTALTRHPWAIPVAGVDGSGRPMAESNYGRSIGQRGVGAPGSRVTSLGSDGGLAELSGTSVAAPFVTGAVALIWSEFPGASAAEVRRAVSPPLRRARVVPPLLDARAARNVVERSVAHGR